MAAARKTPATLTVVRRNRSYDYELADEKDWGVMFENTVLSIDVKDGSHVYWPLDSVIRWTVRNVRVSSSVDTPKP